MEAEKRLSGGSLLVPSVVELVKASRSLSAVPDRYLRHDLQPTSDPKITHSDQQLPIISLASLLQDDPAELAKFSHACRQWGFFQVVGHEVSEELIERFKVESKNLFELPMEVKSKFWQTPEDVDGFGQSFVGSNDQKLEWADLFFLTILPLQERRPHLLPLMPLPFRETIESYAAELRELESIILNCMAKDLKIDKEHLRGLFYDDARQSMRISYYPPCPQFDKVIGLNPHSDASALAIILELNEVEGLQIKKDGRWFPVIPLPGAFVVIIGDPLEIVSNGTYSSVEHRVMVNPKTERLSATTFFDANLDAELGPAPCLVTCDAPARFRRTSTGEYLSGFFSQPLAGKSRLETVRIIHDK